VISVIVPVRGEDEGAVARLAIYASREDCELILAGEESEPSGWGPLLPGVRLVGTPGSRGARLACAAAAARGEILFFLHADSQAPAEALERICRAIDGGAAAGAFSLAYDAADVRMRWIAAWANLRSRVLRLPFGDQGIFCRRDAYHSAGGFRDLPVCDDVDLVRRLRRVGRFVILPERTTTSPRRYREQGVWRQMLRVWTVLGGYFLGVAPRTLGRWYWGRSKADRHGESARVARP
jgi:rSAM/selenodomain-associated transferase 2